MNEETVEALKDLVYLRDSGALSEEQFVEEKKKVLDRAAQGDFGSGVNVAKAKRPRNKLVLVLILVLILVPVTFLVLLAGGALLVSNEIDDYIDEAKQEATKAKCDNLEQICVQYKRKHNNLPDSLEVLLEDDNRRAGGGAWCSEQDIYDAWERPLQILFGERSSDFEVVSYGENGDEDGYERDWGLDMDISSKLPLGGTIGDG